MRLHPLPFDYQPIEVAVEAASRTDGDRLSAALPSLAADLNLRVTPMADNTQVRFGLMSELHVAVLADALKERGLSVVMGAPQIAYREFLLRRVDAEHVHKRILGPVGQFARVAMRYEPSAHGMQNVFSNAPASHGVPDEFVPGVERGFFAAVASGPLNGYPVVACHGTLLDGAYHDVDSSPLAFEIASRSAFRNEDVAAAMTLLEPISRLWIVTRRAAVDRVVTLINSRRGHVCEVTDRDGVSIVEVLVPVVSTFGLASQLKAIEQTTSTSELAGLAEVVRDDGPRFRPAVGMRA